MKYLCFDYGEKRVGVAVSDEGGEMAFPRSAIFRSTRQELFNTLSALLDNERPGALVLGLPRHLDGSDSLTTRQVRNFAASLKRRFDLPLYLMDERLSSAEAESMLRESGQKAHNRDGRIDSLAAARILESFLGQGTDDRDLLSFLSESKNPSRDDTA
ncbi:MAG: Holliday junction resolvase RuvX [Deltaproteobacteria bacterium]|nr:Holliday junction resolvase RuvX [Deltaproteobacteria bacterium]